MFTRLVNSNMLYECSGGQESCHGNQIGSKISQNYTDYSSVQDMESIFAFMVGFSGLASSSKPWEILLEPRELPWQPNLAKNKPKLH